MFLSSSGTAKVKEDPVSAVAYDPVCEIVSETMAQGYVRNASPGAYRIVGPVKFTFFTAGSISHSEIDLIENVSIPSGQRVLVAQTPLPFILGEHEQCRFDVSGSIQKQ